MEDNFRHPADERKVKFRPNILGSRKENTIWIIIITIASFFLSASLLFLSSGVLRNLDIYVAFLVVFVIIFIGIIFDIIGIAVTAADETPFHAMASRKVYGARQSILLVRNANKVSTICNDVVGDICGVISGTASALIIVRLLEAGKGLNPETTLEGLAISGLVASLTVGGKAIGKTIAIENSNYIVYRVGVILKLITLRIGHARKRKKSHK